MRNAVRPKLSQAKVAAFFKIAPPSVAQWELGRSKPEINKLPDLASLYGVTLGELCGDDIPRPRIFVSHNAEIDREALQAFEKQLLLLRSAWTGLTVEERNALLTTAELLAASRRKSA